MDVEKDFPQQSNEIRRDTSMLREIHKLVDETILPKFTDFKYPTDEEIEYLILQLPKDLHSKKRKKLSKTFDGKKSTDRRRLKRKQNYEAKCLLLDSEHNQEAEGLGTFLKQEFGRKLTEMITEDNMNCLFSAIIVQLKKFQEVDEKYNSTAMRRHMVYHFLRNYREFAIELRYELIDLKVTYEDWARSMLDDDQPTDQISLFVLCDMLKLPIAVTMPKTIQTGLSYYADDRDKVLNEYSLPIVLAYNGIHHFTATEWETEPSDGTFIKLSRFLGHLDSLLFNGMNLVPQIRDHEVRHQLQNVCSELAHLKAIFKQEQSNETLATSLSLVHDMDKINLEGKDVDNERFISSLSNGHSETLPAKGNEQKENFNRKMQSECMENAVLSSNPNSPAPLDLDQILDNEVLQKEQDESLEETMQSVLNNISNFSDSSGDVDLLDISMKVNVNNSELNTKDKFIGSQINDSCDDYSSERSEVSIPIHQIKEVLVSSLDGYSQPNESDTDTSIAENQTMMKKDEIQNIGSPIIESCLDPENEVTASSSPNRSQTRLDKVTIGDNKFTGSVSIMDCAEENSQSDIVNTDEENEVAECGLHNEGSGENLTETNKDEILGTDTRPSEVNENPDNKGTKTNEERTNMCHKRSAVIGPTFLCSLCDKVFNSKKNLSVHIKSIHEKKSFSCDQCKKTFTRKDTLVSHMKLHDETSSYICPHCQKTFYHSKTYKQHVITHNDVANQYECHCGKKYLFYSSLVKHRKTCTQ